jgi:hypothetical protein
MNAIRKPFFSIIVNSHDDDKNSTFLEGVNHLLEAAKVLERQEKLDAFKIKSESDVTIILESTQTMVNNTDAVHENPHLKDIYPDVELGPDFTRDYFDHLIGLYWNIGFDVPFFCKVEGCEKSFTRKDNLKSHLKTHIPNRNRPYECEKCDRGYLRRIDLVRHIETVHLGVRKYFCQVCTKSFTRKEGLQIHSKRCI